MAAHDHIALVRRYFETHLKHGSAALIEVLSSLDAPSGAAMQPLRALQATLPDLRFTIKTIVARGDQVEVFATSEITLPPPRSLDSTAQRVRVSEHHILCVAEGQIVSHTVDHTIRIEVWDHHQGWLPLTPPGGPPSSSLH